MNSLESITFEKPFKTISCCSIHKIGVDRMKQKKKELLIKLPN